MTTSAVETKDEKRLRLAALGYVQATRSGLCALCGKQIAPGQYVGRMPDSWRPTLKRRHSHRRCLDALKDKIRAKAERLGIAVPANEVVPDQVVPDQVRATNLVPASLVNTSDEVGADQHG